MNITRDHLLTASACQPGIDWFDQKYPSGYADVDELSDALAAEGLVDFFRFIIEEVPIGTAPMRVVESILGGFYFAPYGVTVSGPVEASGVVISGGDFVCLGNFSADALDVYGNATLGANLSTAMWARASGAITVAGTCSPNCWEPKAPFLRRHSSA